MVVSPEGTAEASRAVSVVPSGLEDLCTDQPNVETLGYCRISLRDRAPPLQRAYKKVVSVWV